MRTTSGLLPWHDGLGGLPGQFKPAQPISLNSYLNFWPRQQAVVVLCNPKHAPLKMVTLIGFAMLLIGCKGPNTDKNRLLGPRTDSIIVALNQEPFDSVLEYHSEIAVFHLPRREVVYFCQTSSPDLQERKDLLSFINSNRKPKIIITDSILDKLAVFKNDHRLKDVMRWATIDILRTAPAKVYDKKARIFVDHIKYYETNGKYSGWIDIRLPNDTLIIHSLVWIQ